MIEGLSSDPSIYKNLDRVIHEPTRLMIMTQLYVVESADFLFLLNQLQMTPGNLSSHLSKLEDAGYVSIVKEFIERNMPRTSRFFFGTYKTQENKVYEFMEEELIYGKDKKGQWNWTIKSKRYPHFFKKIEN